MAADPVKVLIVDDSALVRKLLTSMIEGSNDMIVVGTASDPFIAREKIKTLNPDVITLDIEMPKMDGLTFLSNLMRLRPMPVVMVSTLVEKSADTTLKALELGAVDFVTKPKVDISNTLEMYTEELLEKLRNAASARIHRLKPVRSVPPSETADAVIPPPQRINKARTEDIIAIGASTGGTEAIKQVLMQMHSGFPGIVITQHIPAGFSKAFADRLNHQTPLTVKEAEDGDVVLPGHAFVAPGHSHLLLRREGGRYICRLHDGPPVNRHKPSVDVLFRSVLESAGKNAVAAILTGMGADGASGIVELCEAGVHTIAQDEETSVVWGMPGESVKRGGICEVLPLNKVAAALIKACQQNHKAARAS